MTAAYLDPFAQIVDLRRAAGDVAILIAEFTTPRYQVDNVTPGPESYYSHSDIQYDGKVYIWHVPKLSTLSTGQKLTLHRTVYNFPTFTGQPFTGWSADTAGPFYASPEEALAGLLGVPVASVSRRSYVCDCSYFETILEKFIPPATVTPWRVYVEFTNFPYIAAVRGVSNASTASGSWPFVPGNAAVVVKPTALDAVYPPNEFNINTSLACVLMSGKVKSKVPFGGLTTPIIQVDCTTSVPGPISGETRFNTNRTAALALVGTLVFPGYNAVLIAEFGASAYTATPHSGFPDDERWDGTTYIWKIPAISTLTDVQKWVLTQGLNYSVADSGWKGFNADFTGAEIQYFSAQEDALAFSLGVPRDMVERRSSIGACFVQTAGVIVGAQYQRNIVSCDNIPLFTAKFNGHTPMSLDYRVNSSPYSWVTPHHTNASPSALLTLITSGLTNGDDGPWNPYAYEAPDFSLYDSDTAILTISVETDLFGFYNPPGNFPAESVTVIGSVDVPAAVSGETEFNNQRAGALTYDGTLSYP